MKKNSLTLGLIFCSLGFTSVTLANTGPYLLIGFGGGYLQNAELQSTTVTRHDIDPFTHTFAVDYTKSNSFDFSGRGALGYMFYENEEETHEFGFEAGFNYFAPLTTNLSKQITVPLIDNPYSLTTREKTSTWAMDLEAVYQQNFGCEHPISLIVKLGAGYESMTNEISNTSNLSGVFPLNVNTKNMGVGAAAGLGVQYSLRQHVAVRAEIDGLKGGDGIGYAQGLLGLVVSF